MSYPIWMVAVFITFLVALFGTGALHTTRQIGSATLVGVMAFAMRFLLDNGLGGVRVGTTPLWVVLPLMLSLDIWYAISLRRTQQPPSILSTALVLTAVFGVVCVPVISVVFPFLPLTIPNVVGMLVGTSSYRWGSRGSGAISAA
jgi:hypothetical protein